MLGALLGPVAELGKTWMQGKQDAAKAKAEATLIGIRAEAEVKAAKALSATKMAESGQSQDYDLDRIAMQQMEKSWKDELILIIFLAPMVMAFIPGMDGYALAGFAVIAKMPEWYQYTLIGMIVVIYGMRGMVKALVNKKMELPK
jgi:hypothetical protein